MPIRILVADDNASVRLAICRIIRGSGENWEICYEAVDGRGAVEKAAELRPDLLVLDLLMPYDGISAGREIRRRLPDARMVLNTIWSSATIEREAFEAGFQVVAEKSSGSMLIAAIQKALAPSWQV